MAWSDSKGLKVNDMRQCWWWMEVGVVNLRQWWWVGLIRGRRAARAVVVATEVVERRWQRWGKQNGERRWRRVGRRWWWRRKDGRKGTTVYVAIAGISGGGRWRTREKSNRDIINERAHNFCFFFFLCLFYELTLFWSILRLLILQVECVQEYMPPKDVSVSPLKINVWFRGSKNLNLIWLHNINSQQN